MSVSVDTSEVKELARDLGRVPNRVNDGLRDAVDESSDELLKLAKANARESSGAHGPHYPRAFSRDILAGGFVAEVGPGGGGRQARMSFEYGSRNQPPHLDLNRATDAIEEPYYRRIDQAVAKALW